jgi:hypothetical protein
MGRNFPDFGGDFWEAPFLAHYIGPPIFSWLLGNALGIVANFEWHLRPISEQPPRAKSSQTLVECGFGDLARFGDFRPDLSGFERGCSTAPQCQGLQRHPDEYGTFGWRLCTPLRSGWRPAASRVLDRRIEKSATLAAT